MGSTKLLLLSMVFLAVCAGTCRPLGDDVVEDAKSKAEDAKKFAAGMMRDTEEGTWSFSDWAQDMFSKNFGEDKSTQNMKYNVEDVASMTADTVKSAASGASDYASEKATDAKEAISGAMAQGKEKLYDAYDGNAKVIKMPTDINNAKDRLGETVGQARERMGDAYDDAVQKMQMASEKASGVAHNAKDNMDESIEYGRDRAVNAYDEGKQKMNMASEKFYEAKDKASDVYVEASDKVKEAMDCGMNMAADKANDAKDNIGVANEYGRDKVAETFDQIKREVEEAYASAKNTIPEEAKAKYEAAKEKVSDAAGDLGAKMRNTPNQ
ncbi:unnamed protein product [Sphenostylis stenocarpa]|uniref:Uncharacterized protein n=1 Tax=Sphenostylis stenocarpa TaxID=92480 RepID=A0AA86S7B4_9FABA|nr:unnamed protein product [Sphenostylis stenocarpa]